MIKQDFLEVMHMLLSNIQTDSNFTFCQIFLCTFF